MHPSEADLPNENGLGSVDDAVFHVVGAGNAYEETVERLLQVIKLGIVPHGEGEQTRRQPRHVARTIGGGLPALDCTHAQKNGIT